MPKTATKKPTKKPKEKASKFPIPDVVPIKVPWLEKVGKKLTLAQETFVNLYVKGSGELRGHATLCYAAAYGYDLDALSRDDAVWSDETTDDDGKVIQPKQLIRPSSYDRVYTVCATNGSRLLRNAHIYERKVALLNEMLKDDVVDSRLAHWILQDAEPAAAIAALKEYNKLRKRTTDDDRVIDVNVRNIDDILNRANGNRTDTGTGA